MLGGRVNGHENDEAQNKLCPQNRLGNSLGNLKTVTRLAGTPQAVTDTFTYTADWNQVKTYTDPLNHVTTFGYDERGQLTSIMNHL
ncbi:MAG TPA: hypothetical protein DDY39_17010, partial [Nitrospira sp.]|nr:hypothetical protein [Nitrospira sp.]